MLARVGTLKPQTIEIVLISMPHLLHRSERERGRERKRDVEYGY
jgi:hypothetical protein